MKKSTKTSIIVGVVIVVIGVIVLLCALGISGWNFSSVKNWEKDSVTIDTQVTKIEIKVNYGKVVLKQSAVDATTVTYEYDEKHRPQIESNGDGLLKIRTAEKRWNEISLWFEEAPTMEVTLPVTSDLVIVDLQLNAGWLEVGDGDWGATFNVQLNAGAVSIGDVSALDMRIDVNAGAFDAQKIQSQRFTCDLSAGAFSAKEITCHTFACDISAGAVDVNKLDATSVKLDVSAGSANLGLVGAQGEYNVSVSKSAGSCNVSSRTNAEATRILTVDLSAGSVNVSFGK